MDDFDAKVRAYLGSLTHFHAVPTSRSDVCEVCCGPTGIRQDGNHFPTCSECRKVARAAEADLADHTAFVTYALKSEDKATGFKSSDMALDDMYSYKNPRRTPARRHEAGARIAALLYSVLHTPESRRRIGGPFTMVTFVPSSAGAGPSALSEVIGWALTKIDGAPSVDITLDWAEGRQRVKHRFDVDKFTVIDPAHVREARVLLVEDTWVSGANAQSAAAALKGAGASWVTVLTVARMLDDSYELGEYLCNRYRELPPPMPAP